MPGGTQQPAHRCGAVSSYWAVISLRNEKTPVVQCNRVFGHVPLVITPCVHQNRSGPRAQHGDDRDRVDAQKLHLEGWPSLVEGSRLLSG